MKMTLTTAEVTNVVLSHTATQLNVDVSRLIVVMKADGSAIIYLDQQPDAPVRRNRKAKVEVVAAPVAPLQVVPAVEKAEVQEEIPFSVDADELDEEEVTEDTPAVANTGALWP